MQNVFDGFGESLKAKHIKIRIRMVMPADPTVGSVESCG